MKNKIISSIFLSIFFLLNGCNVDGYDLGMARIAGNKPMKFFHFSNPIDANNYTFHDKDFDIHMLQTKKSDWSQERRWEGSFIWNGVVIYLHSFYHIYVSSLRKLSEYSENRRVQAIVGNNINYLRTLMPIRKHKNGDIGNITLKTTHEGKENYSCIVREAISYKKNKRTLSYGCYKLNTNHTKVKKVSITFTYNKPKNPTLAKHYTYADLKHRAKRMLDSLVIKDGW